MWKHSSISINRENVSWWYWVIDRKHPVQAHECNTFGITIKLHSRATLCGKMASGSCTCFGCSACIQADKECGFTSLRCRAAVEPNSKCYPEVYPPPCPRPPPASGRSCSIPAGPCLFISSRAVMINEALNTSSLSPGPGEPHSWVNRPSRCSTPLPWSWPWGGLTGKTLVPPPPQVETHEICQLCRCSYQTCHSRPLWQIQQIQQKVT